MSITLLLVDDGEKRIPVDPQVANACLLFARVQDDVSCEEIPVFNVDGKTISKVLQFAGILCEWPEIEQSEDTHVREEDFANTLSEEERKSVLCASTYLDFPRLTACVARAIAEDISKLQTVEEIRAYLGVEGDYSSEEEERLREALAFALV